MHLLTEKTSLKRRAIVRLILVISLFAAFTTLACMSRGNNGVPIAPRPLATSTPAGEISKPTVRVPARLMIAPNADEMQAEVIIPASNLHALNTEEQLAAVIAPMRNLRDLALRLDPSVDEIPVIVNETTPDYEIGDKQVFQVHNLESNSNFEITAELVHKTDHIYAWVEEGREFDLERMKESLDHFSEISYPSERSFFGSEWNPGVDNDPRMHILHAYGLGDGIAGYYSSADEYSSLARDFSNEKEMFYINLDWLQATLNYTYYETVLAHEFQHMIHWHNDRNEETWVNEGLSEFAQEVAGYDPDTLFAHVFSGTPDTQLNTWGAANDDNAVHYGSAYLFMAYFSQRFGPDLTRALVAHPANGIRGFDDVLAAAGLTVDGRPMGFDDVFADWVVANYADDPNALGADGLYGYRNFSQSPPTIDAVYTDNDYPIQHFTTVSNYATDYILLDLTGDVTVEFEGESSTNLAPLPEHDGGLAWWSNRGDDFDTRLTRRFDLTSVDAGEPVTMTASFWWDIEEGYDYGYVLASRDGLKWAPLIGEYSDTENAGGNAFGPGYTDASWAPAADAAREPGWVTDTFDLSAYAGEEPYIRFEYVTDDAVNRSGWFVDNVSVPAIDYMADFEDEAEGWQSEGWLLTDNHLDQHWLVQTLILEDNRLVGLERPFQGNLTDSIKFDVDGLGDGRTAVIAVSAMAPVTTQKADYSIIVRQRE